MIKLTVIFISIIVLSACSGIKTFNDYSRAGDTVSIAAGWKQNFHKNNITITITPSIGPEIIIPPNDSAIRAVLNMYPDPVSSLIISREIGSNLTPNSLLYGNIASSNTSFDKEWYQTIILLDLPVTLPTGTTLIDIASTQGDTASSTVEIINGTGSAHSFTADSSTSINFNMFKALERTTNYVVDFTSTTIPHAIEINLAHDPDANNGGVGKAFVVNHLGYKKNTSWHDDGFTLKAILYPASNMIIDHINDYKFYVAGKIENLSIVNVQGFDINGNPIPNISATLSLNDN